MATIGLVALQASGYALGPWGAFAAGIAASYIDSRFIMPALFPADPFMGPRVGELGIQGSDQGSPMAVCYGSQIIRVPCMLIWKSPIIHETTSSGGGKGSNSPESSEDHVFWHLDLSICNTVITDVVSLLADGKVFYRNDNTSSVEASDLSVGVEFEMHPRRSSYDALTDDAVVVIGDTTVHFDGLFVRPGTDTYPDDHLLWLLGEVFIISGQQYRIVSVANWDGNDGDITFWPPAQAAWPDNTLVTFTGRAAASTIQIISSPDPTGTLLNRFIPGYDVTVSGYSYAPNNGTHYYQSHPTEFSMRINPADDACKPQAAGDLVTISQSLPPFFGDVVSDVTIYDGDTDAQLPDPLVESYEGTVPSYRGTAHVVLEHFAGKPYGNRIPNFEACVLVRLGQTVSDVLEDLVVRAAFDSGDYSTYRAGMECRGFYFSGPQSPAQLIQSLMLIYDLVVQDREGVLTFLPRADVEAVALRTEDLGSYASDEQPSDPLKVQNTTLDELDSQVNLAYQRPATTGGIVYKTTRAEAVAKRAAQFNSTTTKIDVTLTLSSPESRAAAERILWTGHANKENLTLELPPSYITLRANDLVQLSAHNDDWNVLLLSSAVGENFRVRCDGTKEIPQTLTLTGDDDGGAGGGGDSQGPPPGALLRICDVAPLQSSEELVLGWYAAVASGDLSAQWSGAAIYVSRDGGTTYNLLTAMPAESTLGYALTKLANSAAGMIDNKNTVDVTLYDGVASSKTLLEVCNGSNWWLIGTEVVGPTTAVLISPNTYRLSGLLRGLRGTESQTSQHFPSEPVMLLSGMPLSFQTMNIGDVGSQILLKVIPSGGAIADYPAQPFIPEGNTMRCFAPCSVRGSRNDTGGGWAAGDILITWIPRSRGLVRILSAQGAPELEPVREFELDIRNGSGAIVRTISVTNATSVVYLASQQTADGLTPGALVDVEIAQVSQTLGTRGRASRQTI